MQQAWDNVKSLIDDMSPHLLRAGVPLRQVTMPIGNPEEIKSEHYVRVFDWLHELKLGDEYQSVLKARALRPEDKWAFYDAMEITGLQEQLLLEAAHLKLRKAWKQNRPYFFGRTFKSQEDTNDESSTDPRTEDETESEQDSDSESSS